MKITIRLAGSVTTLVLTAGGITAATAAPAAAAACNINRLTAASFAGLLGTGIGTGVYNGSVTNLGNGGAIPPGDVTITFVPGVGPGDGTAETLAAGVAATPVPYGFNKQDGQASLNWTNGDKRFALRARQCQADGLTVTNAALTIFRDLGNGRVGISSGNTTRAL